MNETLKDTFIIKDILNDVIKKVIRKEQREKQKTSKKRKEYEKNYKTYKWGANRRNKQFEITIDYFENIKKFPCFYCGLINDFIGIDRVFNKVGYIIGNCVSCCGTCNQMKHIMDPYEFINQCRLISYNFHTIHNEPGL